MPATASAKATSVTSSGRPLRSFSPRRSHSDGTPAAPMARPTVPSRHGRPTLSDTITPMSALKCASSLSLRRWALASGSSGSSSTRRPWSAASRFDWSMPALAMIRPWRVATISTLGLARSTSTASRRMASTRRASLPVICASSRASSLGSSAARSTSRPSAFDTILLVTTTMSRERGATPSPSSAAISSAARSSPACTCGMPPSVTMVSPELLKSACPVARGLVVGEFQRAPFAGSTWRRCR